MDVDALNTHTVKAALTLFCCILLIPAWKWYMIPFMVAEGWKIDFPLRIQDLHKCSQQMAGVPESGELTEEQSKAEAKRALKKIEQMKKVLTSLGSVVDKHALKEEMAADGEYHQLAGDDKEALRKQNEELRAEVVRANAACQKAQQMLDATMANMLSSMKQMNDTMGRIESAA